MLEYPYSDEYMIFDENTQQYVLTNEYVLNKMGIDLSASINERNGINPQIMVNRFLADISDDIYGFIHSFNVNAQIQNSLIAHCPSLRDIIQKAMDKQLLYSRFNGLLGYSADKDKQENRICPSAKSILAQVVPELGRSILYSGRI